MRIEQIDRLVAPKFPMVGTNAPETLKMTPAEWVDIVDRAIQLVGEDHVALGSDFDGGPTLPRGVRDIRDLPMITEAMLRRGYTEERIRKFLGGNLLRLFNQVTGKRGQRQSNVASIGRRRFRARLTIRRGDVLSPE